MTAVDQPLTVAKARECLRDLARRWDDFGFAGRELLLGALAHPSLKSGPLPSTPCTCQACLGCVWDAYCGELALMDGFGGECDWRDINPEAISADSAWDEIQQRVGGLEDLLLRGAGAAG
jgi:hypothetical protein